MTIRKIIRTSQPQTPCGIDWSNPITRGLEVWMNGGDSSTYTQASGGSARVATPKGLAPMQKGQGSYTINRFSKVCTSITIFVIIRRTDGGATSTRLLRDSDLFIDIRFSTASTLRIELYDSNTLNSLMSGQISGIPAGEFVHACVTINFPMMRGASYANGVRRLGIVPEASTYTFGPFGIITLDNLFGGDCPLILMLSRELSATEVKSLSDNPWQVFQPLSQPIYTSNQDIILPSKGYPTKDLSKGLWTGFSENNINSTLSDKIDEDTLDTSDYVYTDYPTTSEYELSETQFPGAGGYQLSYNASGATGAVITVKLRQGMTEIAQWQHPLTVADTTYTQTLTPEQVALIVAGPVIVNLDVN